MIGFDYGTSNCAIGVMQNNAPHLLNLGSHGRYISSSLYSPSREVIVNWLNDKLPASQQKQFQQQRQRQLQKGQGALRELVLDGIPTTLSFGQDALNAYLEEPDEGYYIKSPKSFLGASGLLPQQIELFEDIVAAMMSNIKNLAEDKLQREITQTVIGRPVNFQGLKGKESNAQAINVLSNAAKRVGFKDVEFQYEPVAAGFEFESSLTQETKVLVVDIGGGTTDCSMILMGPKFSTNVDRTEHLLAHTGQRIGGNDFDIGLALKGIMPALGMESILKTGKPMPVSSYWQAVAINNMNEQTEFYSQKNARFLEQLCRDAKQPDIVARLLKVQQEKLSYQIVNNAEQAKIGLSDKNEQLINLNHIENHLAVTVNRGLFLSANQRQLIGISQLMHDAVAQAGSEPDVVFVTGGTAKSPVLNDFLQTQFKNTPLVTGDHFGSVTAGLTRRAELLFS
ncbi:MAG: putative chaperone protein [Alteromonadaceae bacterium]|jgi:hypothetical chaperone protein